MHIIIALFTLYVSCLIDLYMYVYVQLILFLYLIACS